MTAQYAIEVTENDGAKYIGPLRPFGELSQAQEWLEYLEGPSRADAHQRAIVNEAEDFKGGDGDYYLWNNEWDGIKFRTYRLVKREVTDWEPA